MRSLYFAVKLRRFGVAVSSAAGALGAATTREGGIAGEISDPASGESGICEGITMGSVSFALKCKLQTVKCLTLIGTEGQAIEGMAGVFSDKIKKAESKDGEIKDLHAKIGQLAVENDFLSQGLKR